MKRLLIAVDGSRSSDRAVEEVIKWGKQGQVLEVHLVNVQSRIPTEDLLVSLRREDAERYYFEQSAKALAWSEKMLKDNAITYTAHRVVGPAAQSIVAQARNLQCDGIVMGSRGQGRINGMALGSVSMKVIHLADRPVTLVRGDPPPDVSGRLSPA
jgi:nucleotide-binding universal stress UspA family protein